MPSMWTFLSVAAATGVMANDSSRAANCSSISANQIHKNPRPVEYLGAYNHVLHQQTMTQSEWEDR